MNDPPTLDLNGLHRPGLGYEAVMGERERQLGLEREKVLALRREVRRARRHADR